MVHLAKSRQRRTIAPYKVIENDLRRKIHNGTWSVGSQIPSRLQLARDYSVDLSTIQKAVTALLTDGFVQSEGKRGTYVRRVPSEADIFDGHADVGTKTATAPVKRQAAATAPSAERPTRSVGVVGRFAPQIPEHLVAYVIGLALEHELAADRSISLRFYDCFQDIYYTCPFEDAVKTLVDDHVDMVCVILSEAAGVDGMMAIARASRTPILFVTTEMLPQPVRQVYIDNTYDGYQAANHLLDMGHKEITFVSAGSYRWSQDRLDGVRYAVRHAGLPDEALRVFPTGDLARCELNRKELGEPLKAWVRDELARGSIPNAIIAANDYISMDITDALEEFASEQLATVTIIGFDDKPEARQRGLTTLRPPHFDMANEGARLIKKILNDGDLVRESTHIRLTSQLIVRTNTR